jgi:hypothetical protein
LVFEFGGGFNKPGSNGGIGGGLCHLEQRRCCFASVVAVLGHGTGNPIFWRINAQPKITFRSESIKMNRRQTLQNVTRSGLLAKQALGVRMSVLEWAKLLSLSVSLSALLTAAMGTLVWVVVQ